MAGAVSRLASVLLLCMGCAVARAADYYVDATNGRDSNAGTSQGAAWQNLSKVTAAPLAAGDRVFFKRGETWRGQLRITRSGTAASPITFGAYGTGAKPTLNGSAVISNWTSLGNNLWTTAIGSRVELVFFNGVRGNQRASAAQVSGANDWFWGGGTLTVFSSGTPSGVEACYDLATLLVNNVNYVKVQDLKVIRGVHPVWVQNTTFVTIDALQVEYGAGYAGIYFVSILSGRGRNNTVSNCEVSNMLGTVASRNADNDGSGIYIDGHGHAGSNSITGNLLHDNGHEGIQIGESDSNIISGNTVYNHRQSGIRVGLPESFGNIVEHNTVYDNAQGSDDRYGIDMINVGNDNIVRYNITHGQDLVTGGAFQSGGIRFDGNNGIGVVLTESTGNAVYYNLIYDEYTGINVFSFSNVSVVNNTVVGTKTHGIAANAQDGVFPSNTIIGNNIVAPASGSTIAHVNLLNSVIDHNLYKLNSGAYFIWGLAYLPWATYRTLTGQDAHSLLADPLFMDAAANDYRLQSTSAARDAATAVGLSVDIAGTTVPQGNAPDLGAYEYTDYVPPVEGEGVAEGGMEGSTEGMAEGTGEGVAEGGGEGTAEGTVEGMAEGIAEGTQEGTIEGTLEGVLEGSAEGMPEGEGEGAMEGATEGAAEGMAEGEGEGAEEVYDFSANITEGTAPLRVVLYGEEFLNGRKDHIAAYWEWDFGDGTGDSGRMVEHQYAMPGEYTVTLKVTTEEDQFMVAKARYIKVAGELPAAHEGTLAAGMALIALSAIGLLRRRRAG